MRIISKRRLREFWENHPDAESSLLAWHKAVEGFDWANFSDVRVSIGSASGVPLNCGITVIVFNVGGGKYRLVTRIEYEFHVVYIKRVMTHKEYDKNSWKEKLCRE